MAVLSNSTIASSEHPITGLHSALAQHAAISVEADAALAASTVLFDRYAGPSGIGFDDEIYDQIRASGGDVAAKVHDYDQAVAVAEAFVEPEIDALSAVQAALSTIERPADVMAVVRHAAAQHDRPGEEAGEVMLLRQLVDVLTVKLFGAQAGTVEVDHG